MSFSIEDRDRNGRKKSAFYSVTASRGAGAEITEMHGNAPAVGFDQADVRIVRAMLCKHVVGATYDDAARRGLISRKEAGEEAKAILASYDEVIYKAVSGSSNGSADSK